MITVRVVAAAEAATGVALILAPQLVAQLLFGGDVAGAGQAMARIAGIALLALGIACWPSASGRSRHGQLGMLIYSGSVMIYLGAVAANGELGGTLLLPAVAAHLVVTVLLARAAAAPIVRRPDSRRPPQE